jgi:hypothetical protein
VSVIRKAKRLSAKLGRQDISDWLDHEQSGYPRGDSVPDYRVVRGTVCYNTNGDIPAGLGMMKSGIAPVQGFDLDLKIPQTEPISTVASQIAAMDSGKGLYLPTGEEMSKFVRKGLQCTFPEILDQLTFLVQLNESQVRDIPEQVKNKVLDWACKLESAGVTGDGVSFSQKEKEAAQHVTFNISHSTVGQISDSGSNISRGGNG